MGDATVERIEAGDELSESADIVEDNLAAMRSLFPEAFSEDGIDFEALRQLLGDEIADGDEKYGLSWHGKKLARRIALTPSMGTLRPCREESVDWDATQNLMIEGDNLEVLKLLQKSYSGKVKLIYIDPPYNTGKDFVYKDNFRDSIANFLEVTGQTEDGAKLTTNTETSGRFHTDWLNMMYPRLKLARDLLTNDGAIFATIDDTELGNLIGLMKMVFGEENYVGAFIWEKRLSRENRKAFSVNHDYLVVAAKSLAEFEDVRGLLPMTEAVLARYQNPDNDPRGDWQSVAITAQAGHGTRAQFYSITTPGGRTIDPSSGNCWRFTRERLQELIDDNRIWFGPEGNNVPRQKAFLSEQRQGLTPHTIWAASEVGTTDTAMRHIKGLFDDIAVFDTPKPVALIERVVQIGSGADGICLDFFAGSGPLAEAVTRINASDDESERRYILVQLPEPLDHDDRNQKAAAEFCDLSGRPRNIAELTKERLRRAGAKVREENPLFAVDVGFRVFKLDASNIRAWSPDRDGVEASLLDYQQHLADDRSQDDILYEMLLKLGLDLCVPIEERDIGGVAVSSVGGGVLMTCLAESIPVDAIEALGTGIAGWLDELEPAGDTTVIFRDSAFENDVAKTNIAAILDQTGVASVRSI